MHIIPFLCYDSFVVDQPLDPTKFHILSPMQKKYALLGAVVFSLVVLPLLLVTYYNLAISRPAQTDKELTFEIKTGDSVYDIAHFLFLKKAINSEYLFILYVKLNGIDKKIQAGEYFIKPVNSVKDLGELFQHGVNDTQITFLEGWRVEEFARAASVKFPNIDAKKFIDLATKNEGYLFPDTYMVNKNIQEDALILDLTNTFETKTKDLWTPQKLAAVGMSKKEVLILASIVEREVSEPKDRPLVAGIFINRLKNGDRLDADATTQYAVALNHVAPTAQNLLTMNWWPKDLTQEDLALDSPYNTRKVKGLPPAPICSPSLSAISAVLSYVTSDYYFYLTDTEGVTHYAKTLREHEANIAKYLN